MSALLSSFRFSSHFLVRNKEMVVKALPCTLRSVAGRSSRSRAHVLSTLLAMSTSSASAAASNAYDFVVKDKAGQSVALKTIVGGKVSLFVNTASQCGFTGQYKGLQELQEKYQDKGFSVLAFPSNQFGGQEPGSNEEIQDFVCSRFKATFPIFGKVNVKGWDNETEPLWIFLKDNSPNVKLSKDIWWNFEKVLVDRQGKVVGRYASTTSPESIAGDIEAQLAK